MAYLLGSATEWYVLGTSPQLWYKIEYTEVSSTATTITYDIKITARFQYTGHYLHPLYGFGWRFTQLTNTYDVNIKKHDAYWNAANPVTVRTFNRQMTFSKTSTGNLLINIASYKYENLSTTVIPICGTINTTLTLASGKPLVTYKKATISHGDWPTDNLYYTPGAAIDIHYTANSSTDTTATTVQYSLNNGAWTNIAGSGNAAGKYSRTTSDSSWTIKFRRIHSGGETFNSDATVNKTLYTYKKATITHTTTPVESSIHNAGSITIGYSANSSGDPTATTVEYAINSGTWHSIPGSGNAAGTFNYTAAAGTSFTVQFRRIHSSGHVASNSVNTIIKTLYTYTVPTLTGLTLKNNDTIITAAINANKTLTSSWDSWTGHVGKESTKVSIKIQEYKRVWVGGVFTGSYQWQYFDLITLEPNALSGYTFTPTSLTSIQITTLRNYDNADLYLLVTRTHDNTAISAEQRISFKLLFKPTSAMVLTASPITLKDTGPVSTTISWTYPTGETGIVTGYSLKLSATGVADVNYTLASNISSLIIKKEDIIPGKFYTLTTAAYYSSNITSNKGPNTSVANFIVYDKGTAIPSIIFPLDNTYWAGPYFRIIIQMPEDQNYSLTSYRYEDIQIKFNNLDAYTYGMVTNTGIVARPDDFSLIPSTLTHKCQVVFKNRTLFTAGVTVKVRVKTPTAWTEWSPQITIQQLPITNINFNHIANETKVLASDMNNLINVVQKLTEAYGINTNEDLTLKIADNSLIRVSDFTYLQTALQAIITKINAYIDVQRPKVRIKTFSDTTFSTNQKIVANAANNYFIIIKNQIDTIISLND